VAKKRIKARARVRKGDGHRLNGRRAWEAATGYALRAFPRKLLIDQSLRK